MEIYPSKRYSPVGRSSIHLIWVVDNHWVRGSKIGVDSIRVIGLHIWDCLLILLQVQSLMETLSTTEPHYIRCVKPNNVLKPTIFENLNIILQLRVLVSNHILTLNVQQANRRNPRSGIHKLPSQAALAFGKRNLARCKKFENSGVSCFTEPPFQDTLFAPIENDTKLLSDETFAINGSLSNKGKKKEILLNNVGTTKSRKPGPKPKPKPRQKTGQMPTKPGRIDQFHSSYRTYMADSI